MLNGGDYVAVDYDDHVKTLLAAALTDPRAVVALKEALRTEFLRYVEVGLLSIAAHVAKDLGTPSFRALAEIIYEAVDIEKARQG